MELSDLRELVWESEQANQQVRCPKCGAPPGIPCQSIKDGRPMRSWPYRMHKKRLHAVILGAPSTELLAVPVRPARRPRVGAVDSAARGLSAKDTVHAP